MATLCVADSGKLQCNNDTKSNSTSMFFKKAVLSSAITSFGDLVPIPHQAAGHANTVFWSSLKEHSGTVFKPVKHAELQFYEHQTDSAPFARFLPKYFGATMLDDSVVILLEDLTAGVRMPCIMDLKIGFSTAAEDATEKKRSMMLQKDTSTTTKSLGMRICGLQLYDPRSHCYVSYDKVWGKALTDATFLDGLATFFFPPHLQDEAGEGEPSVAERQAHAVLVLEQFCTLVDELLTFMNKQREKRFYSSSLLFVYDADVTATTPCLPRLRMIDMAHVFPYQDDDIGDNGYCDALCTLRQFLDDLRKRFAC